MTLPKKKWAPVAVKIFYKYDLHHRCRRQELLDGLYLGGHRSGSRARDALAQKLQLGDSKHALADIQHHPILLEPVKEELNVLKVLLLGLQGDEDVIINKTEPQVPHHLVHESLEGLGRVAQAKGNPSKLEGSKRRGDGGFLHVLGGLRDLVVDLDQVYF